MIDINTLCGYIPNPVGCAQILASIPHPIFAQAAPNLMYGDQKDVYLYKAWKDALGSYPHYIAQQIGDCFPANTMVLMSDFTEKPIQDVKIGDKVISHKNKVQTVTNVIEKHYEGELVEFCAKGFNRTITSTPDHLFVTYPGMQGKQRDIAPTWEKSGNIEEGTKVLIPWGITKEEPKEYAVIDTLPFVRNAVVEGDRIRVKESGKSCKRFITVNPSFCWLLGLYLAEGGITNGPTGLPCRVDLSLGGTDYFEIMNAVEMFKTVFDVECTVNRLPSKPNVVLVRCGISAVADIFKSLIPGNLYSKYIPSIVFQSSKDCRLACLRGWLDGDGCIAWGSSFKANGIGSSHRLINDMFRLSLTCGLRPKLHQRKKYPHQTVAAKSLDFYGLSALPIYPEYEEEVKSKMNLVSITKDIVEDGLALPVKGINKYLVDDSKVFCLSVENDNSFIANSYGVHNCTSFASAHNVDLLQAVQIAIGKKNETWKESSTEAQYGVGREIAGMLGSRGDGCYGAALAKAVSGTGVVPREVVGAYSGQRAKDWGYRGTPEDIKQKMKDHLVKTVSMVTTWDELVAALSNGYPVCVCSNQGFQLRRNEMGIAEAQGSWSHAMLITGIMYTGSRDECAIIANSWGDDACQGPTPNDMPPFCFGARRRVVEGMLAARDSWVYSTFDGYPGNKLPDTWTVGGWAGFADGEVEQVENN